METLSNWFAFAVLVYGLGVGAGRWPGPVATTRHLMSSRHQNRRSDTGDTPARDTPHGVVSSPAEDDEDPIEFGTGVYVSAPRTKIVRQPFGPVPLDTLTGGRTQDPPPDDVPVVGEQVLERRRWVRARLDPDDVLKLSPVEIDRQGAELFGCAERTIQRDRERIVRQRNRSKRPPGR